MRFQRGRLLTQKFFLQLLLLCCVSYLFQEVDGNPTKETVTKARCYANCLTQNPAVKKEEEICETQECKDCLIPCENPRALLDESACAQYCQNASSCLKSCEFLTGVKNFSSLFTADGSMPPIPSIPTETNVTFTSISLEWVSVANTSGSPVYLVEMAYSEGLDNFKSVYLSEAYIQPRCTISLSNLCARVGISLFGRSRTANYETMYYKFRIAVLTENSSLAYGQQTREMTLLKPDAVTNLTINSVTYDATSAIDKIKLTASWTPSKETEHLLTEYGTEVETNHNCSPPYLRRFLETSKPVSTFSVYLYENLKKCKHTLRVYSLISCSVSDPAVLRYTYPGCQNITNYPLSLCYQFDPPDAPIEDRVVRHFRLERPLVAQMDYTFHGTVTWDLPVYPFKKVQLYYISLLVEVPDEETGFDRINVDNTSRFNII